MFVPPSSPAVVPVSVAPRLEALGSDAARGHVRGLVAEFESVTDPRGACGVRYRVSSLLALVVCAMTPAGHDSITAAAEWCRRAAPEELAAFGLPYHPLLGRYRIPSEKTLRTVLGRLDPGEVSAAGYDHLRPLLSTASHSPEPLMPDGGIEREQRRAHRAAARAEPVRSRRRAIAVDGKCLRSAKRPDGSRVFVLSAVRHGDGITLASREIG
ncbi:transposase family protein, partial [Streptomyces sp. MUSC 125]